MADASKISVVQQAGIEEKDVDVVTSPQSRSGEDPEVGKALTRRLLSWGVESRGIVPVSVEERTDTQFYKIFFIWFTGNFNILSFSTGTLGPAIFGLSTRDSCLVILFFNILCCLPPAYLATWGPKLGLRQMVQARFSFGYYGVIIPCVLNLVNLCGFCILDAILGGQTLASVADGNLSWTVGIVIITLIALFVSFCGYTVLNWYERLAWIPVLVCFVVALGLGGGQLTTTVTTDPATPASVFSFASVIAGFVITYSSLASDFTNYYKAGVESSKKIALYSYFGFLVPITTLQCLGAAVAAVAPLIPEWDQGWNSGDVGGLLAAMLNPVGNFGKFLTVLLSLSVAGDIAATFYSISLNIQVFIPALVVVPRYIFSLVAAAIVLPLSIAGAHRFYDTLENFLSLIGYWASDYVAIVLVEHFVYRRRNNGYSTTLGYDLTQWNRPELLPTGIPAILAGFFNIWTCYTMHEPSVIHWSDWRTDGRHWIRSSVFPVWYFVLGDAGPRGLLEGENLESYSDL